jgi:hypothetical protein
MRRIFFDLESTQASQLARGPFGWIVFAPGAALVLLGLLIWAMPRLLVALVAGACVALGGLLLMVAWRLRRHF